MIVATKLTARQATVLRYLQGGMVLRRLHGHRSYSVTPPGDRPFSRALMNSAEVLRLQTRFLEGFDAKTGAPRPGASAYGRDALEFRIKEGVSL